MARTLRCLAEALDADVRLVDRATQYAVAGGLVTP